MKTKQIGELLQERREQLRLSIDTLARLTKIKPEYLTALENNEFSRLPPAVYVRGYVRTLAQVLGLEVEPIVALLRRDYHEKRDGYLESIDMLHRRKPGLWRPALHWPTILAGSLIVTVLCYMSAQWLLAQRPPELRLNDLEHLSEIAAGTAITGRTSPDVQLLVNGQPTAIRPDGMFSFQLPAEQSGLLTITIEATDQNGKSTRLERSIRVLPLPE